MADLMLALGIVGLAVVVADIAVGVDLRTLLVGGQLCATAFLLKRLIEADLDGGYWYVYPLMAAAVIVLVLDSVPRIRARLQGRPRESSEQTDHKDA